MAKGRRKRQRLRRRMNDEERMLRKLDFLLRFAPHQSHPRYMKQHIAEIVEIIERIPATHLVPWSRHPLASAVWHAYTAMGGAGGLGRTDAKIIETCFDSKFAGPIFDADENS